jgi:hypothetical protein
MSEVAESEIIAVDQATPSYTGWSGQGLRGSMDFRA